MSKAISFVIFFVIGIALSVDTSTVVHDDNEIHKAAGGLTSSSHSSVDPETILVPYHRLIRSLPEVKVATIPNGNLCISFNNLDFGKVQ